MSGGSAQIGKNYDQEFGASQLSGQPKNASTVRNTAYIRLLSLLAGPEVLVAPSFRKPVLLRIAPGLSRPAPIERRWQRLPLASESANESA